MRYLIRQQFQTHSVIHSIIFTIDSAEYSGSKNFTDLPPPEIRSLVCSFSLCPRVPSSSLHPSMKAVLPSSSVSSVCWEWQSSSADPASDVWGLPMLFGSGEPNESNWDIRSTYRCEFLRSPIATVLESTRGLGERLKRGIGSSKRWENLIL